MAADGSAFADWSDAFDIVPEAMLLVDGEGRVAAANPAARERLNGAAPGEALASYVEGGERGVQDILARLRGGAHPLPFILPLKDGGEGERIRATGKRLRRSGHGVHYVIRIPPVESDRFAALSLQIEDLDNEVRARRIAQRAAEDALEINRLLTRELHHRVNNNLQLQISLLRRGARTTGNSEVRAFIEHAIGRLRAMSAGLDLTYHSGEAGVDICDLVEKLASQGEEVMPAGHEIRLQLDTRFAVSVAQVTPLALIIHETLTRIFIAGQREGQTITLASGEEEASPMLELRDGGDWSGVDEDTDMALANALIDTLARQAGVEAERLNTPTRALRLRFFNSTAIT